MSWLDKIIPPIIKRSSNTKKTIPDGLWVKCPSCESVLYRADLEINLQVCPKCEHHLRISARKRIDHLLDDEKRIELAREIFPVDILKFKDLKKKLYVSAFCLNTSRTEYFSVDTHPDMYVIDAVCMSMSIPFVFTATTFDNKTYVDGGLIEKLPYAPFIHKKPYLVHGVGIKANTMFKENIESPIDFLQAVAIGAMNNREDYTQSIKKTIINVEDIDVFNFDMDYEDKLKLYFIGLNNISANIYGEH